MITLPRIVATAILLLALRLPAMADESKPIEIGAIGPFTGGSAPMGVDMLHGMQLAVKEINGAGGVLGRPIVLVIRNDRANNDRGAAIGAELTQSHPVVAAVGFVNTGVTLAALPYFEQSRIPLIVAVATGSLITKQFARPEYSENYIFRMSASTAIETAMIAREAITLGYRTVSVFADTTPYGQVGRHDLIDALAARGIAPVSNEKFNIGDNDMTQQLTRARAAGAQVVLTYGIGPELAEIANDRARLGWPVPMIGSWTLSMSNFIDATGKNGEGTVMPQTFIETGDTPRRARFIDDYHKTYATTRMDSPPSAAQGYDAIHVLAAAIAQAGSTEGPQIRAALDDLHGGIKGVIKTYNRPYSPDNHEAIGIDDLVLGVVKEGRVVRLGTPHTASAQGLEHSLAKAGGEGFQAPKKPQETTAF